MTTGTYFKIFILALLTTVSQFYKEKKKKKTELDASIKINENNSVETSINQKLEQKNIDIYTEIINLIKEKDFTIVKNAITDKGEFSVIFNTPEKIVSTFITISGNNKMIESSVSSKKNETGQNEYDNEILNNFLNQLNWKITIK